MSFNILQQNNDIQVNSSFVSGLNDLKWKINRKQNNSLVQTSMDIYLDRVEIFLFYLYLFY